MYRVKVNNKTYEFNEIIHLKDLGKKLGYNAYVAEVNNRLRELNYYLNYDCNVEFLELDNFDAVRVYETSFRYLLIMALENLYPKLKVRFGEGVSKSIFCTIEDSNIKIDEKFLKLLTAELTRLIELDLPIKRIKLNKEDVFDLYAKREYHDKIDILKYRSVDYVNVYQCQEYVNYMFGYMVPSTGYLSKFKFRLYYPGFTVLLPRAEENGEIPNFVDSPSFARMLSDVRTWSKISNASTIVDLNKQVENSEVVDLVNMCETKHNNMLADLGLVIKSNIENIRLICIAGPSSSGKTTFSNRLRIELMTRGIKPIKISLDDYYLNKNAVPLDEFGNIDLESIHALDVDLFNEHLLALISGETVDMPLYDFKEGRKPFGRKLKVPQNVPIIIEGIHALNETLTASIPKHNKFKIYISPTFDISIDSQNPIASSEIRMLRRIVRDKTFRKTTPSETFAMWESVRRGEFKWIYPFQDEADYIFNTELSYELGVMKKYALPILEAISTDDEYFIQSNRIVKFLKYFLDIDDEYVPCNSLLREFIGGSTFKD
jgi:uridine kinase